MSSLKSLSGKLVIPELGFLLGISTGALPVGLISVWVLVCMPRSGVPPENLPAMLMMFSLLLGLSIVGTIVGAIYVCVCAYLREVYNKTKES
jgi:hypothetical protein